MKLGLKEKLFLFSVNQETGIIRNRAQFNSLIFYSSLFDLARMGSLTIENGHWHFREMLFDDPVLDKVLNMLLSKQGQKTQWVLSRIPFQTGSLFRLQVDRMKSQKLIQVRDITFLGMRLGYRFRVMKPGLLKADLLQLERTLVYGRKPDTELLLLIMLLGVSRQHKRLFSGSEIKKRVHRRYRELRNTPAHPRPETYRVIFKKLRETLRAN